MFISICILFHFLYYFIFGYYERNIMKYTKTDSYEGYKIAIEKEKWI